MIYTTYTIWSFMEYWTESCDMTGHHWFSVANHHWFSTHTHNTFYFYHIVCTDDLISWLKLQGKSEHRWLAECDRIRRASSVQDSSWDIRLQLPQLPSACTSLTHQEARKRMGSLYNVTASRYLTNICILILPGKVHYYHLSLNTNTQFVVRPINFKICITMSLYSCCYYTASIKE